MACQDSSNSKHCVHCEDNPFDHRRIFSQCSKFGLSTSDNRINFKPKLKFVISFVIGILILLSLLGLYYQDQQQKYETFVNENQIQEIVSAIIKEEIKEEKIIRNVKNTDVQKIKNKIDDDDPIKHCNTELSIEKAFYADTIPDYALKSAGAEIIRTINTETFGENMMKLNLFGHQFSFFDLTSLGDILSENGPQSVIQPWHNPGECWMFKGTQGTVQIKLSHEIIITSVTLEHVPLSISPDMNIDSAPRHFTIIGIENDDTRRYLGYFEFDKSGPFIQTFQITTKEAMYPFSCVELRIVSNHGNELYTCVYKLRVHGKLFRNI